MAPGLAIMAVTLYFVYRSEAMFDEWEKQTGYRILDRVDFVDAEVLAHKLYKYKIVMKDLLGQKRSSTLTRRWVFLM